MLKTITPIDNSTYVERNYATLKEIDKCKYLVNYSDEKFQVLHGTFNTVAHCVKILKYYIYKQAKTFFFFITSLFRNYHNLMVIKIIYGH